MASTVVNVLARSCRGKGPGECLYKSTAPKEIAPMRTGKAKMARTPVVVASARNSGQRARTPLPGSFKSGTNTGEPDAEA